MDLSVIFRLDLFIRYFNIIILIFFIIGEYYISYKLDESKVIVFVR